MTAERVEILGYQELPEGVRAGVTEILGVHGASIRIVNEAEFTASGLILATKPDLVAFNESLPDGKRGSIQLIGRSWGMPNTHWRIYQRMLAERETEDWGVYERRRLQEYESIREFRDLFVDTTRINVSILDVCLNAGMTDVLAQTGDRVHGFLRAFADDRLTAA